MNEGKIFDLKYRQTSTIEDRSDIEQRAEEIKSMEIDWKLEDDAGIISFAVSNDLKSINYSAFGRGEKVNKSWNIGMDKLNRNFLEPKDIIDDFDENYGTLAPIILKILEERCESVKDKMGNDEYNKWLIKNSEIFPVGDCLCVIAPGSIIVDVIDTKNKKHLALFDEEEASVPKGVHKWSDGENIAVQFDNYTKIFDINNGECIKELTGINGIGDSQGEGEAIAWQWNGTISILDKKSFDVKKLFDCNLKGNNKVFEINDGNFIVYSCGQEVGIIDKKTGEIIKRIEGESPFEDPRGGITILNNGVLEFWRFGGARGKEPIKILIRGNEILNEWERFCEFDEKHFALKTGETTPDAFWFEFSNLETKRLGEKKQFEWGEERIYFHIKSEDFDKLSKLIKNIAGQNDIALSYKYYDTEKNGEPKTEETRFVVNFASVANAKKLYEKLAKNEEYKKMVADGDKNYFGYQLDSKACYARGYKEEREDAIKKAKDKAKNFIKNSDGTYTEINGSEIREISESEYLKGINGADFSTEFKKAWEDGLSEYNTIKVARIDSNAFGIQ